MSAFSSLISGLSVASLAAAATRSTSVSAFSTSGWPSRRASEIYVEAVVKNASSNSDTRLATASCRSSAWRNSACATALSTADPVTGAEPKQRARTSSSEADSCVSRADLMTASGVAGGDPAAPADGLLWDDPGASRHPRRQGRAGAPRVAAAVALARAQRKARQARAALGGAALRGRSTAAAASPARAACCKTAAAFTEPYFRAKSGAAGAAAGSERQVPLGGPSRAC